MLYVCPRAANEYCLQLPVVYVVFSVCLLFCYFFFPSLLLLLLLLLAYNVYVVQLWLTSRIMQLTSLTLKRVYFIRLYLPHSLPRSLSLPHGIVFESVPVLRYLCAEFVTPRSIDNSPVRSVSIRNNTQRKRSNETEYEMNGAVCVFFSLHSFAKLPKAYCHTHNMRRIRHTCLICFIFCCLFFFCSAYFRIVQWLCG